MNKEIQSQTAASSGLRIEHLSYTYPDDGFFLSDMEIQIPHGTIMSLIGPNGSGKTTLIKLLSGSLKPGEGEIQLDGQRIQTLNVRQRAQIIALVPQLHHAIFPYTVAEVITLGRNPYLDLFQLPSARDKRLVEEVSELLNISHLLARTYTRLSGGERQLVMIARALVQEPQMLLLDEPTAHLDFHNQIMILDTVRKLARNQKTVVLISMHDPNLAIWFADTATLLVKGKLLASGSVSQVITSEFLSKAYGMEISIDRAQRTSLPVVVPHLVATEFAFDDVQRSITKDVANES